MKVLVVGKGGREHALVWKIAQSSRVSKIFCAPGNAGIGQLAECVNIVGHYYIERLIEFAKEKKIDLTVVGPEGPLYLGNIVNRFQREGLRIFGPNVTAASIEGSKILAKLFMRRHNIPTADFKIFGDSSFSEGGIGEAIRYATAHVPCVIKFDGLADGKGVFPCTTEEQALAAIYRIMVEREFNNQNSLVIEDFLEGEELTFTALTDGSRIIPLLSTQDHKRLLDGDKGPNTGGMGAYAPVPMVTRELERKVVETIIEPTLKGMKEEGWGYRGVLYAGLMLTQDGPKVLEFNCRFGDPELQPLVLLMKSDIVPVLTAIAEGSLTEERLCWSVDAAVCRVMVSKGYGYVKDPEVGKEIKGLEAVSKMKDVVVFHAGTIRDGNIWKTAGGRVLGVTAKAKNLPEAIALGDEAVSQLSWEGEHDRTDIGKKALQYGVQFRL